jgi:AraC-like DNA-binding protein
MSGDGAGTMMDGIEIGADDLSLKSLELPERVARLLDQMVEARGGSYPSLAEVSSRLLVSTRTLKRRLRERRTSFRKLVASRRMTHAADLLARSSMALGFVAESAGYSSKANFARAFRRWSGLTPSAFRRRMQKAVGGH